MSLAPELVAILRCPESGEPLLYFPGGESGEDETTAFLLCAESALKYRIDDGIPVLLVEEAERVDQAEVARLRSRAAELGLE